MAAITVPVVNVNGLNKRDDLTTIGTLTNWKDLNVWMEEQERYFDKHRIESDEKKIDHVIMNLDVRHWGKLESFFKYNLRNKVTFAMLKRVLCKKVKRIIDPTMSKYDEKVDGYVEKLNIQKLDFDNMQAWMKKMRSLCDGQGKEDYLIRKLLARVADYQKEQVYRDLLKGLKNHVETYGSRLETNGQSVGKEKKKELAKLAIVRETISNALNDL